MGKIQLLSKTLQNQIAAGEVVERPASVVKELLENSVDAGAKNISIEIENGGIQKIRVIDDGEGMDREDLLMSYQRYATSKISSVDDLFSIHSFGFRGEAIASIASVSLFTIRTKTENAELGIETNNSEHSGKNTPEITPCACPKGTEILVENLFWNVPARKKFLKSENSESREITKLIEAFSLANEKTGITFKKDGKLIFQFFPEDKKSRAEKVIGKSVSEFFLPVQFLGQDIKLSGFCTHPNFHRSTRDKQFLFVNNRIVHADKSIQGALSQAYATLMPKGKFPAFVLFFDVHPEKVDVNVHPRKTEVRFHSPSEIFQITKGSVISALSRENSGISPNMKPEISGFVGNANLRSLQNVVHSHGCALPSPKNTYFSPPSVQQNFTSHIPQNPEISGFSSDTFTPEQNWTIIGQVRKSFIIREEELGIRVIDQHAAHERVRYEQLLRDFRAKKVTSQQLLTPIVFSVSVSEKMLLLEEAEILQNLGFEIEDFGGQEISVLAVPTGNATLDIEKLFRNLLDDLDSFDPIFGENLSSFAEKALSYTACRGAKKFGDVLSFPEMEQLMKDWDQCTHKDACAHGRPVSTFYPFTKMENECGRY